jgi:hypothetical protein
VLVGDSLLNAQISLTNDIDESNQIAVNNKMSVIIPDPCITVLKSYYNLSNDESIIFMKTDYSKFTNLENMDKSYMSNLVNFKLYHPTTRELIDLDLCGEFPFIVKTHITNIDILNMTYYYTMKDSGIDIYNPSSPAFNDICIAHIDTDTGFDTTLNWRRKNYYQNLSCVCEGANCTYIGIDHDEYINCECYNLKPKDNIVANFVGYLLSQLSVWNFGVFLCYVEIGTVRIF